MSIYGSVVLYGEAATEAATEAAIASVEEFRRVANFDHWREVWRCEPPGKREEFPQDDEEPVILPTQEEVKIGGPLDHASMLRELRRTSKKAVRGSPEAEVWRSIEAECRAMPESIRGRCVCNSPRIFVGPHDLANELGEYQYYGLATFSLQFFGWNCPNDWVEYSRRFVEMPTVALLRKAVEKHVGPLKVCMCFTG